jgi:hypothetical protein
MGTTTKGIATAAPAIIALITIAGSLLKEKRKSPGMLAVAITLLRRDGGQRRSVLQRTLGRLHTDALHAALCSTNDGNPSGVASPQVREKCGARQLAQIPRSHVFSPLRRKAARNRLVPSHSSVALRHAERGGRPPLSG